MALTDPTGQPGPMQPGDYTPLSQARYVQFKSTNIAPPAALYLRLDDTLRCRVATSAAGFTVALAYRFMTANDGFVHQGVVNFPVGGSRAFSPSSLALGEGFLLGVNVFAAGPVTIRGQSYAIVDLVPGGQGVAPGGLQTLCSGYIVGAEAIGWPYGRVIDPTEGPGWIHSQQVANPAAGADWSFTVPVAARIRIRSLSATLTTSATVANRVPQLMLTDGTNVYYVMAPNQAVSAGITSTVSAGPTNVPVIGAPGFVPLTLPGDAILPAGHVVKVVTAALQAGDQWTNIWLALEEWIEA